MKGPQIRALKKKRYRKITEGLRNPGTPLQIELSLVKEGITKIQEVKRHLHCCVKSE